MTCQAIQRRRVRNAEAALADCESVLGVDVLTPREGPVGAWTVEATLAATGVPPAVSRAVARAGLTIRAVKPRGGAWQLVAVAN
ncbi:hypothetical protein [Halobellus ordinarius]|uniref:hypothetical protein n=1 Tax=Halobellus ordinarius TaxID=3075120 RepID=UPI0028808CC8|nr:hypothetical protein [Halobellus sp. ZY16]